MTRTADIVIAGAGHNSLITAAYLARAGYECAIVDARPIPGGGATTEEIMLDGFWVDTCSTGHTLIQVNPLIRLDELGLVSKYGLSYLDPDPVEVVAFPDGEALTMWLDIDQTSSEIARFSDKDAEAYRRLISEYDEVKTLVGGARFRPVGHGRSAKDLLEAHPRGGTWLRRSMMSARDVILHEFESPHVRAFMGWMASQTAVPIDGAGTGLLPYQIVSGRQARSWSIPKGGSGQLIDALVGYLEDHGATIDCNMRVSELVIEDGRCVGLRTDGGEEYRARHAVVSTIHVKHLVDMAPKAMWGDDFVFGVDTYHLGIPFFAAYFATTEAPRFTTHDGTRSAVSAGVAGWIDDAARNARRVSDGFFVDEDPFFLVATPTLVDPDRSPEGTHTVKMVTFNAYDPGGGPRQWDDIKDAHADRQLDYLRRFAPNMVDDVILARLVKSPLDIERQNPHMVGGAPHGGDRGITFSGDQRPVPGWAQHRMPIPGLYQTGGTTHPGGSITGAPGRNAAIVLLSDLGRDPSEFMSIDK
jgi:phytoene dehydrogenase-like protein